MYILVPLFTALIAAGAFIKIPVGAMAITLQTLFCFVTALLLSPTEALLAVLLYLFIGAIGLPVFTTGGGIAALMAPSGGFLFMMVPSVFIGALLAKYKRGSFFYNVVVLLVMEVILYAGGVPFLAWRLSFDLKKAFTVGALPYLLPDAVKIVAASLACRYVYPELERLRAKRIEKEEA